MKLRALAFALFALALPSRSWAVISFIASAVPSGNPTTSHTVVIPASTQTDDVLILLSVHNGTGTLTVTDNDSGGNTWTLKDERDFPASPTRSSQLRWKRATSATASKTVTVSVATNCSASVLVVYRGVHNSGDPIEALVSEANASADETQAQITTLTDGALVLLGVSQSITGGVATSSQSTTSPGALTERAEKISTGGTDCSCAIADAIKTTAGATGAFTWAQTNGISGSVGFALQPLADPNGQQFVFPVDGWVVGTTQYPEGAVHPAGSADISCQHWTKVVAARSGTVSQVTQNTDGSWFVVLDHTLNYQTLYGHWAENAKPDLTVGQAIAAGEEIGYIGRTGVAVNPHLHFCIALNGIPSGNNACLSLNVNSGDWVERGTHIPQDFTTLAQIPEKPDTVVLRLTEDSDAYELADASSTIMATIPAGSVVVRDQSEDGFYRVSWNSQDVWVPTSVLLPMPLATDGRYGPLGSATLGEVALGTLRSVSYLTGLGERYRVWPNELPAYNRSNGQVLWNMPVDTIVTLYEDYGDGWVRIMDNRFPNAVLGSVSSIYSYAQKSGLIPVEEFEVSIGARDVDARDAPSTSGTLLGMLHVDEPTRLRTLNSGSSANVPFLTDPNSTTVSRYTTVQVHSVVDGWYQIDWPPAADNTAWIPGWKCMGRR